MKTKKTAVNANEKASSQSSDKLLQILEAIAHYRMPVRLQDLAELVGMTQPTVLRYLNALQNANYVYQEEATSRYALTWKVCRLSENLNSYLSLRNITSPFISQLAGDLDLGVCLTMDQDYECVYLDCIDNSAGRSNTLQRIGRRSPLHATASGKIMLSSYSESQIDAYISIIGLKKMTDHTIGTKEELLHHLDQVREKGFAMDEEECELGLRCIAFPLIDFSGKIIAAMSVFGNTSSLTQERIDEDIYSRMRSVTGIISSRLGYSEKK